MATFACRGKHDTFLDCLAIPEHFSCFFKTDANCSAKCTITAVLSARWLTNWSCAVGVAHLLQFLPLVLSSSLILVLWIWLTGGLHLDGLADTADAWVGGFGDPERSLDIMKDPSSGPIGVLSLLICCLLKWSALYVLLEQQYLAFLLFVPVLGRLSALVLFLSTPYLRANSLGTSIQANLPKIGTKIVIALTLFATVFWGWMGLVAVLTFILSTLYLRYKFMQRLGGITGDTVGASIEITESLMLLAIAILWFLIH